MRDRLAVALVAVLAASCGGTAGTGETTITLGAGAGSPTQAVEDLGTFLQEGDFAAASSLAVPGQAALAALAEGASFGEVAEALENGDTEMAANFWSGFAQGAGETLTGELTLSEGGSQTESEVEFHIVDVASSSGGEGRVVTQEVDGHRVDLFASFGAGLSSSLIAPYEQLLETPSEDGATILEASRQVVPSLLVAASDPNLDPNAVQEILRLIELMTRVG
jgi:hypothetical protein